MWDATALHVPLPEIGKTLRFAVSHISRKTSEIPGTPRFVEGKKTGWATVPSELTQSLSACRV
jgi:hypothetical protein